MAEELQVQKVVVAGKSMAMAIILAIIFGPLGLMYASVMGGVVMLILTFVVAIFTLGFGAFLMWPVCVAWAAVATNSYNKSILAK